MGTCMRLIAAATPPSTNVCTATQSILGVRDCPEYSWELHHVRRSQPSRWLARPPCISQMATIAVVSWVMVLIMLCNAACTLRPPGRMTAQRYTNWYARARAHERVQTRACLSRARRVAAALFAASVLLRTTSSSDKTCLRSGRTSCGAHSAPLNVCTAPRARPDHWRAAAPILQHAAAGALRHCRWLSARASTPEPPLLCGACLAGVLATP